MRGCCDCGQNAKGGFHEDALGLGSDRGSAGRAGGGIGGHRTWRRRLLHRFRGRLYDFDDRHDLRRSRQLRAFGKNWNFAGGASGDRTAFNNSTLCGNPQGAAGELNP
jgi:hypothetical protein